MLVEKYEEFFPEKDVTIFSDDQPFFSNKLRIMKRRKGRVYSKYRRSEKWKKMNEKYELELDKVKQEFYNKKIKNLRKVNPKYWYREFKKLTSFDQHKSDEIVVEDIKDLPNNAQVELIADKFAAISQEYDKLEDSDIEVPDFSIDDIPIVTVEDVEEALTQMDTNKSNVEGDVPAKVLTHFAKQLAVPVAVVINSSIKQGCWPDIFKLEMVTPVPKVYPPKNIDDLRNISGLLNLDKISEKIISKLMIADMKKNIDPSQYANQKGLSIQHYLVKILDKI